MMKIAFFKGQELNEVLNDLLKDRGSVIDCKVGFCEEIEEDGVEIFDNGVLIDTIAIEELLSTLSTHLNVEITHYDVIEVGDQGEGFAFFF